MTKGFDDDFVTVEFLLKSKTKTGRTDAFIIAYSKMEKQVRRIFTFMIFQYPVFNHGNLEEIINCIASKRFLDFDNFIQGFDALYPTSFESVVGSALYSTFMDEDFPRVKNIRNKITHGQPTGRSLNAIDLADEISVIRNWCLQVANTMKSEICFDGFEWNSFTKCVEMDLVATYNTVISSAQELNTFIETNMR